MSAIGDKQRERTMTVFRWGWEDANNGVALDTPRKVAEQYPSWTSSDIDTYLNGREDGLRGDTFRLDYEQLSLRDVEGESHA